MDRFRIKILDEDNGNAVVYDNHWMRARSLPDKYLNATRARQVLGGELFTMEGRAEPAP